MPADYGFSGFGEACAGGSAARRGIARIEEGNTVWSTKWHERYRARLCSRIGSGVLRSGGEERMRGAAKEDDPSGSVAAEGSALLSKIRAFSEGWVVGSVAWVESFCAANGWLGYQRGRKAQAGGAGGGGGGGGGGGRRRGGAGALLGLLHGSL